MDSEGPDLTGREAGAQSTEDSVAAGTSARVNEVLERAEARGRAIRELAERDAAATEDGARQEAERLMDEARQAAQDAACERVQRIAELRSSIAARAGSLVEGLEGAELTRARLEELVAALGAAADAVLAEAGLEPGDAHVHAPVPQRSAEQDEEQTESADGEAPDVRTPHDGPLPEGAPMVRRPKRLQEARFAAVLMAIQGQERGDVEQKLVDEYGVADCDQLLNDVFGRVDATA
jgi:hypothetical protein